MAEPGESVPIDLLLDADGDIDVSAGDLAFALGAAGVVQACESALSLVLAEWFLDLAQGVDYFGKVLVKNPNLLVVNGLIRAALLAVPFVNEVVSLGVGFAGDTRTLSITWRVSTDFGVTALQNTEFAA